ncbi:hypothetical protein SOVF_128050, partial [Spinacia oleracea]
GGCFSAVPSRVGALGCFSFCSVVAGAATLLLGGYRSMVSTRRFRSSLGIASLRRRMYVAGPTVDYNLIVRKICVIIPQLWWNKLQDVLPPEMSELKNLTHLYLSFSNFKGGNL